MIIKIFILIICISFPAIKDSKDQLGQEVPRVEKGIQVIKHFVTSSNAERVENLCDDISFDQRGLKDLITDISHQKRVIICKFIISPSISNDIVPLLLDLPPPYPVYTL